MKNFIPKIIDQYAGGSNGKPLFEPKVVDFPQIIDQPVVRDMNPIEKVFNNLSQLGGAIITLPNGNTLDVVTTNEIKNWDNKLEINNQEVIRKNNIQNNSINNNRKNIEDHENRIKKLESNQVNPTFEERLKKLENEARLDNIQDSNQQREINQNRNIFQRLLGFR